VIDGIRFVWRAVCSTWNGVSSWMKMQVSQLPSMPSMTGIFTRNKPSSSGLQDPLLSKHNVQKIPSNDPHGDRIRKSVAPVLSLGEPSAPLDKELSPEETIAYLQTLAEHEQYILIAGLSLDKKQGLWQVLEDKDGQEEFEGVLRVFEQVTIDSLVNSIVEKKEDLEGVATMVRELPYEWQQTLRDVLEKKQWQEGGLQGILNVFDRIEVESLAKDVQRQCGQKKLQQELIHRVASLPDKQQEDVLKSLSLQERVFVRYALVKKEWGEGDLQASLPKISNLPQEEKALLMDFIVSDPDWLFNCIQRYGLNTDQNQFNDFQDFQPAIDAQERRNLQKTINELVLPAMEKRYGGVEGCLITLIRMHVLRRPSVKNKLNKDFDVMLKAAQKISPSITKEAVVSYVLQALAEVKNRTPQDEQELKNILALHRKVL